MKNYILGSVFFLLMAAPVGAASVAWISMHPTDDPVAQASAQGYTQATDIGYVDLLRGAGHSVTRVPTQSPTQAYIDNLNTFDLVIVSRQVGSGDYQDPPEQTFWHSVSKPMMLMSGYILRGGGGGGSRLQLMAGETIPDASATQPTTLTATLPSHPIFQGITLDGSNNMTFATYPISTPNGAAMRGISAVTGATNGGGQILATVAAGSPSAAGNMLIGHWPTGSILGPNTLAAPRMAFLSGTREPATPADIPLAGVKDLTPAGDQLFLNSVCFMIGGCGPPLVPGDTDGDGIVELTDFDPIRANFRKSVTARTQGDLVPNGIVDFADFEQWKTAFAGGGGSLAGLDLGFANVPEPGACALLIFAMCSLVTSRIRRTYH
jgi:hypothetical protein